MEEYHLVPGSTHKNDIVSPGLIKEEEDDDDMQISEEYPHQQSLTEVSKISNMNSSPGIEQFQSVGGLNTLIGGGAAVHSVHKYTNSVDQ